MAPNVPSVPPIKVGRDFTIGSVSNSQLAVGTNIYQFNNCTIISPADLTVQDKLCPNTMSKMPSPSLPLSAWPRFADMALNYADLLKRFSLLTRSGEYEQAKDLYWQILYFTGTREFWNDRIELSKEMLKLSIKEKDYKTSGLIWARGVAYHQINTRNFSVAKISLQKALDYFIQAKAYPEIGVVYEYLAALNEETGQVYLALDNYKEAMKRLSGIDQYKIYLKKMFVEAKNKDLKSGSRIIELTRLHEKFSSIKSYREAMVGIELAKSLNFLKDPEAPLWAQQSYNLLHNEIQMPRNAEKAKEVFFAIMGKKPIVEV